MADMAAPISIRLRAASPGLLALPWLDPLETWPEDAASFRDLNVGPSRHLVRFVEADYVLYALKELPTRIADKEYRVPPRCRRPAGATVTPASAAPCGRPRPAARR